MVIQARGRAHELTYTHLAMDLNDDLRRQLDDLLQPDVDLKGLTPLVWIRRPARGYGDDHIVDTLSKLIRVQTWAIDDWQVGNLPPARVRYLVGIARRSSNQALQRKAPQQRYPILMAFLADAREQLTDEVLDLFDRRLVETERSAKQELKTYQVTLSDMLQRAAWTLGRVANVMLDETVPDEGVRSEVFRQVPRERLVDLVAVLAQQQRTLDKIHFIRLM